jgi:two-component system sensor histidine kinase EvgS
LTIRQEERNLQIRDLIHDLKNSFLAFQGLTGILEKKSLDARQEEQIRRAVRESRQSVEKLLTQLWNMGKEGSLPRSEEDSCNLSEVIQSLVKRYQLLASEKGVLLSCQTSPIPSIPLKRKMDRIGRAIENIIDNALKYTGEGGEVHIQVEYCKSAGKGVEVSPSSGETFRITVSDTGIGVHAERLREIREGLSPSTIIAEDTLVSFGHGLAFVKRVAEEMGGNLFIESEPQKGTKVTLTFCIETTPVRGYLLSET